MAADDDTGVERVLRLAEIDDLAAEPGEEIGLAHGFRPLRDHGDASAPVEHAVAGAAIADAAPEQLVFAGEQLGLFGAGAEDDAPRFDEIRAQRERERIAHGDHLMDDAGAKRRAQRLRLIRHGAQQVAPGDIGQAGIVGDVLRAGEPAGILADDDDGLIALSGGDGGAVSGRPRADDGDVDHASASVGARRTSCPCSMTVSASPESSFSPVPSRETLTSISRPR